ncbi:MAG: pectinesterase family protein [Dyella sp.]|uniref:pectinesterase family protein n=1 Tax=Dyella sp. TaxID=1869338 RepID=UPI003F80F6EA
MLRHTRFSLTVFSSWLATILLLAAAIALQGAMPATATAQSTASPAIAPECSNGAGSPGGVLVSDMVTVKQDGTGDFKTISDAIASATDNSDGTKGYYLIHVTAGTYKEKVSIPKDKKYLMLLGDGIGKTIITYDDSTAKLGMTTFESATLAVVSPNFIGVDFTVENTAGAGPNKAVAMRSGADLSAFYCVEIKGDNGTLYAHSLRQFYKDCVIYGSVDTVFGNAAAVFQDDSLIATKPATGQQVILTAQGRTDPNQNTGFVFQGATVTKAADFPVGATVFLGRPWKAYARTVFMQSQLDGVIDPAGWTTNGLLDVDGLEGTITGYFGEYANTGAGSDTTYRVNWLARHDLTQAEAQQFTVSNFILGDMWLPGTGVPYQSGL